MFDAKLLFEKNIQWEFPSEEKFPQSQFAAKRKFDIHTGIDIFVPNGTKVHSMNDGIVVNVEWFTGINSIPPTPWWNDTKAVWIQGMNKVVIVYGEIETKLKIGQKIKKGQVVGKIIQVLKKQKVNPPAMLHLEMYKEKPDNTVIWNHDEEIPNLLLNPLEYMKRG